MVDTWKYRVIREERGEDNKVETRLNELGKEGWELVAVDSNDPNYWAFYFRAEEVGKRIC